MAPLLSLLQPIVLLLTALASNAFFMGSENKEAFIPFEKLKEFGLSRDHKIYAHLVIPPWRRPFKLGYCESWEWHTDPKYRDQRIALCKELSEGLSIMNNL